MTDDDIRARWERGGEASPTDQEVKADQAATSAPIGISSRQIFAIALLAVLGWQAVAA